MFTSEMLQKAIERARDRTPSFHPAIVSPAEYKRIEVLQKKGWKTLTDEEREFIFAIKSREYWK